MVAARIANLEQGRPTENKSANLPSFFEPVTALAPVATARAAEMLNVSTRTVEAARAVLAHATPALVAKVERGACSLLIVKK
jgi:hypothetical protein